MREIFKDAIINNKLGLHARPAAKIAQISKQAESNIWIARDGEKVNASSVIDLLSLACNKGTKVTITIDKPSDLIILNKIIEFIETGFGE